MRINIKIKDNSITGILLLLLIFCSPNLVLVIQSLAETSWHIALIRLFNTLITAILFIIPFGLLRKQQRWYIYLLSFFSVTIPFLIFVATIYNKLPTRWLFIVIFESTLSELIEFLCAWWILTFVALILPILVVLLGRKYLYNTIYLRKKHSLIAIVSLFVLYSITLSYKAYQQKSGYLLLKKSTYTFFKHTPVHTIKRFYSALRMHRNPEKNSINISKPSIVFNSNHKKKPNTVILIIGESARYSNWGINGYKRNTSPNLLEVENLISYSNLITPSFSTKQSIPNLITTLAPEKEEKEITHTLQALFKTDGYKTYWISAQQSQGTSIGKLAKQSDSCIYVGSETGNTFDEQLIPHLNSILSTNKQNLLIVLHTNGSHYPYWNRYPEEFNLFTPAVRKSKQILRLRRNKQRIINSYDNSIAYTDFFINQVITNIDQENKKVVLCYLSDHGENLFETGAVGFGRGYGDITQQLFHIPLFFWANDNYLIQNELKWNNLKKNKDKPGSSTAVIFTLCDLAEIHWEGFDTTNCLSMNSYNSNRRYIIYKDKLVEYDKYFEDVK